MIFTLAALDSISLARCSPNMICAALEFPYAYTVHKGLNEEINADGGQPALAHKSASIEDQRHPAKIQASERRRRR